MRQPSDKIQALANVMTVESLYEDTIVINNLNELASAIGIEESKVRAIEEEYKFDEDGQRRAIWHEFLLSNNILNKPLKLEKALNDIGYTDLATKLSDKYLGMIMCLTVINQLKQHRTIHEISY